jgi:hypothetical protein
VNQYGQLVDSSGNPAATTAGVYGNKNILLLAAAAVAAILLNK